MQSNQNHNSKLITGLFMDHHQAGLAYNVALKLGYNKEDINILMSEDTKNKHYDSNNMSDAMSQDSTKAVGVGGSLGVTTGIITGAIMAIVTGAAVASMGLVIAGPLAIGLAGASAGGIAGGLVGALINAGISEEHASTYENQIKTGAILIGITARSEEDLRTLEQEWKNHQGQVLTSK